MPKIQLPEWQRSIGARQEADKSLYGCWLALATGLATATAAAVVASHDFDPDRPRDAMPMLAFAIGFLAAGLVFLLALPLVRRSARLAPGPGAACRPMLAVFAVGLAMRLLLLASEPILEVDFNRYLWDGGLAARGFNPFGVAPAGIAALPYDDLRLELSKSAGQIFDRISYPELKTIYPPVAQAFFALAHAIGPWSLTAWRLVAIAGDVASFLLLVGLLSQVGRSPLWSVLYWWNPLVLKEIANSAHMEAVLLPLVLASLWLAGRGRHMAATVALGLAAGTKLWPLLLAPLVLRPLFGQWRQLALAACLLALIVVAALVPIWLGGIDAGSGFVAFAEHWSTNSALFPALKSIAAELLPAMPPGALLPGRIVRLAAGGCVALAAVWLARPPIADAADLARRAWLLVSLVLLLSPAQFPWYVLWVLPLAVLQPGIGWHVCAALMPLYYTAFHLHAQGRPELFDSLVVWAIWGPTWLALACDAWRARRGGSG